MPSRLSRRVLLGRTRKSPDTLESPAPGISLQALGAICLPFVILILPVIYYWPILGVGFLGDDFGYTPFFVLTLDDCLFLLGKIQAGEFEYAYFRPVGWAMFRVDYMIWGPDPIGLHMTNVLLHSINAALLYYLALSLGMNRLGAGAGAVFYGLYPAHPEAVTWICGRFDVLSATGVLSCLLLWIHGRLRGNGWLLAASVFAFFLACFAKEGAAASLVLIPLADWVIRSRVSHKDGRSIVRNWIWYLLFVGVILSEILFRLWLYGDLGGYLDEHLKSTYMATDLATMWDNFLMKDLWMMVTPISRSVWPSFSSVVQAIFMGIGLLSAVALSANIAWSFSQARKNPRHAMQVTFGVVWIIVMLAPAVPIEGVWGSLDCARFLYVPVVGLGLLVGSAADAGSRGPRVLRMLTLLLLAAVLFMSGLALRRNHVPWIETGEIAGRAHAVLETHCMNLPDGASLFIVNVPLLRDGAHLGPVAYSAYLDYKYGIKKLHLHGTAQPPGQLDEWWEELRHRWTTPGVGFAWDEETESLRVLPPIEHKPLGGAVAFPSLPESDDGS